MAKQARRTAPSALSVAVTLPPVAPTLNERIRDRDFESKLPYPTYHDKGKPNYDAMRKAYQEDVSRLSNEFYAAAMAEVGLTSHPKAAKAWAMAWDRGHSAGYGEVLNELREVAELLLDG
jgi:hypothetical protein